MKGKKRVRRQEAAKRLAGACFLCGENRYELLDCHRIIPGADGGRYHHFWNCLCLCAGCHRKVETGLVKIIAAHTATFAPRVVHFFDEHGVEHWKAG